MTQVDPLALAEVSDDAAAFERSLLHALQRAVGFDIAFFATLGARPTTLGVDPQAIEQALTTRRYATELAPVKAAAMRARGVAVDTEILGEQEARRRAYHRDFVSPRGGRHSLMAHLTLRGRPLGALVLGRAGCGFSAADVAWIEALLPRVAFARASFHAPFVAGSLPSAPQASLVRRVLGRAAGDRILARRQGAAGEIVVRDRRGFREMVALRDGSELIWSRADLDEPGRSGWFYVELFHLAAARARQRRRVLFIGCGGAVGVRQFAEVYPGVAIDLVDVDPAVIALANDWYGLGALPWVSVHMAEGFDFVAAAQARTWDVVIVDAYDASDPPRSLTTNGFFRHLARVLRPGGAVACNTIGSLAGNGPVRCVERAARSALADVRLVPVLDPGESFSPAARRNVVVLASAR